MAHSITSPDVNGVSNITPAATGPGGQLLLANDAALSARISTLNSLRIAADAALAAIQLSYLASNWQEIFSDIVRFTGTVFDNLLTNAGNFGKAIWGAIKGEGWSYDWKPLTDGFSSAMSKMPDIAARQTGALAGSPASRQRQVQLIVVKIESNATGGGKYNLTLLQPKDGGDSDDVDDTSDLTADDLGKDYDARDDLKYLGIYPPEIDTSDHALLPGQPYVALIRRRQTGDSGSGQKIVAIILGGGGSLSTGQYKDDYYKMVSQNQAGWGPITARAM